MNAMRLHPKARADVRERMGMWVCVAAKWEASRDAREVPHPLLYRMLKARG